VIKHVVLVELPEEHRERGEEILAMFRQFVQSIPGVTRVEAGEDFSGRCRPYSLIAILEMADRPALESYSSHPEHLQLLRLLDATECRRLVADFEVSA